MQLIDYREEFIRNNRNINNGENLPQEFLENLYSCIKTRQIQVRYIVDILECQAEFIDSLMWTLPKFIRALKEVV